MTLQETIERKLYETWCEVHGFEPNWGRSTLQSPSGFKTSRSLWTALAHTAIACVREHATSEEAVERAWWAHMRCEDGTAMDMFRAAILAALGEGE